MKTFSTRKIWRLVLALCLAVSLAGVTRTPARAASLVVKNPSDDSYAHDANPGDGICADSLGACTLRAAIEEANALSGEDTITFDSLMNIYVDANVGQLPALSEKVKIDASSAWDNTNNTPGVMINGNAFVPIGLEIKADECELYGLYLTNFTAAGVGVLSDHNTIGGIYTEQRNVLSGNFAGIWLNSVEGNWIRNNYIGLAPSGMTTLPNDIGVYAGNNAKGNVIGSYDPHLGNFITGNKTGVLIQGSNNFNNDLDGNKIGLAADNAMLLGNSVVGIHVSDGATGTSIGHYGSQAPNVIAGSGTDGVFLDNARRTAITENEIEKNGGAGIHIQSSSEISILFNTIADNSGHGVWISGASALKNLVLGNSIYQNAGKGIELEDGANTELAAPTITRAAMDRAVGTGCGDGEVHLYKGDDAQGKVYVGRVYAHGGQWDYYPAFLTGSYTLVTATCVDAENNTSEFSLPVKIDYSTYLPVIVR